MSTGLYTFSMSNPSPTSIPYSRRPSMPLCPSPPPLLESSLRPSTCRLSLVSSTRLGLCSFPLLRPMFKGHSVFAFSASHEESSSELEVEKDKGDIKSGGEESEEAWKKTLASFKEQALKIQSISQEAYALYYEEAIIDLKETSEKLKIQAEKAREDLTVIAQEITKEGMEYLFAAAENSPEPVKVVVETFAFSGNNLTEVSQVRDFDIGIPYGFLVSFGGFLSFMLTGSISAIRFGVILGGTLLALSVSSLRSRQRGESSSLALKGQTAIASILFIRDLRALIVRSSFGSLLTTLISGGVLAFYIYRIITNDEHTKESSLEPGTQD